MIRLINPRRSISAAPVMETRGPIEPRACKKHLHRGNNSLSFCRDTHFVHVVAPAHYLISWRKWKDNYLPCRLESFTNPGKFIPPCLFAGRRTCFLRQIKPAFFRAAASCSWHSGAMVVALPFCSKKCRLVEPSSDWLEKYATHNVIKFL